MNSIRANEAQKMEVMDTSELSSGHLTRILFLDICLFVLIFIKWSINARNHWLQFLDYFHSAFLLSNEH